MNDRIVVRGAGFVSSTESAEMCRNGHTECGEDEYFEIFVGGFITGGQMGTLLTDCVKDFDRAVKALRDAGFSVTTQTS